MNIRSITWAVLLIAYTTGLLFFASTLSISEYEADIFFNQTPSILYYVLQYFVKLFGANDVALRLPMVLLHLATLFMMYKISQNYFKRPEDVHLALALFVLIPGVIVSSVLVHHAGLIMFLVVFFVYMYQRFRVSTWVLMPLFIYIDYSFYVLTVGVFIMALIEKKYYFALYSASISIVAVVLGDIFWLGSSQTSVLQTLGLYVVLLSPVVFFYFLYVVLFRIPSSGTKDILWAISLSGLIFSLLLSIRQPIPIEFYEPYVVVAMPLLVKQFLHTFRVRISQHRRHLRLLFTVAFMLLLVNSMTVYFNKLGFAYVKEFKNHIFYPNYFVKELAHTLKSYDIDAVNAHDGALQKRLKFYEIGFAQSVHLHKKHIKNADINVTISYMGNALIDYSVTK